MSFVRAILYLAVSGFLSWHFLVRPPIEAPARATPVKRIELAVAPAMEQPEPEQKPEQHPEQKPEPGAEQSPPPPPPPAPPTPEITEAVEEPEEITPPPAEAGAPEGDEEEENTEPIPEEKPISEEARVRNEIESISSSTERVDEARRELAGKTRRGFTTEFDTVTRDQLAIARYFGEQVLLIPRKGLDPRHHYYFVIDAARSYETRRINDVPPSNFRQVRDLLDPDIRYSSLPGPLKTLRRQVTLASEIFLFAAAIPPREWAIVMARRADALERCNTELGGKERTLKDLRRVKMRYVPLGGGGFDIQVKEFVFADGTRWKRRT